MPHTYTQPSVATPLHREVVLPRRRGGGLLAALMLGGIVSASGLLFSLVAPRSHAAIEVAVAAPLVVEPAANGWLGVAMEPVNGAVVITEVLDCPAAQAGLRANDVLVSWRSHRGMPWREIGDTVDFKNVIRARPNQSIELLVARDGTQRYIRAAVSGTVAYPPTVLPRESGGRRLCQ